MSRKNLDRALGPYREPDRYRAVIVPADGARWSKGFPFAGPASESAALTEAQAFVARFNESARIAAGVTIEEAFLAYERDHAAELGKDSLRTNLFRLRAFFDDSERSPVSAIDLRHCEKLFAALAARQAPDTALNTLATVRRFFNYCVAQKWCRVNPVDGWKPKNVGQRNPGGKGKKQLSFDALALWEAKAYELAEAGDDGAAAGLIAVKLSLRASKIVTRQAQHVDLGGALLRVPREGRLNRTKRHPQLLPVEDERLRPILASLAHGKAPEDWLFPAERMRKSGHRRREWVTQQIRRVCRAAGVPEDTHAHGMRGSAMSLDLLDGRTLAAIQQQAGHRAGSDVTERSYLSPESIARARQRRLLGVMKGGK